MSRVTYSDDRILNVTFVQSGFFVDRIRYFEGKYEMQWGQFLAQYTTGALESCSNTDFAEWAFLCNNFMSELLKPDEAGPPVLEANPDRQKPERDSGFFIVQSNCVQHSILLRAYRKSVAH
jgi:hypothetical protein